LKSETETVNTEAETLHNILNGVLI